MEDVLLRTWAVCSLVLVFVAVSCGGGGELSLSEYVDQVNVTQSRAIQQYRALIAGPGGGVLDGTSVDFASFTPQDLQAGLERAQLVELEAQEALAEIEPPEIVSKLHNLLFDDEFDSVLGELAARAGAAADWYELSVTPEMEAYRVSLAGYSQVCFEFETELNATVERGVFADTPWIPAELKEVVEAVFGCSFIPEHPEDVYRPPPTAAP